MPRLENWSVCYADDDPYRAPETRRSGLQGTVYDHPLHDDGTSVVTSYLAKADGRTVTTSSGSVYTLGTPDPAYVEWCSAQGHTLDPDNPVTVHTSG